MLLFLVLEAFKGMKCTNGLTRNLGKCPPLSLSACIKTSLELWNHQVHMNFSLSCDGWRFTILLYQDEGGSQSVVREAHNPTLHRVIETHNPPLHRVIETHNPTLHRVMEAHILTLHMVIETHNPSLHMMMEAHSLILHRVIETHNPALYRVV